MSQRNCFRIPNHNIVLQEQILLDEGYGKCFYDDEYTLYVHDVGNATYLEWEDEEEEFRVFAELQKRNFKNIKQGV